MMPHRLVARVLLSIGAAVLTLASLEIVGQIYFYLHVGHPFWVLPREQLPEPYRTADYYSEEFMAERWANIGSALSPSGTYYVLREVRGRYINVANGLRVTTDQPPNPRRRLLVFGGSAVTSEEVPDWETIPSHLQRLVNARCADTIEVSNHGVPGITLPHQLERLTHTPIAPHDIVVFYDGVNDVFQTLYNGRVGFSVRPNVHDWLEDVLERAQHRSAVAAVVADLRVEMLGRSMVDGDALDGNLRRLQANYLSDLSRAQRSVTARGGSFHHFLQPQLLATRQTPYRQALLEDSPVARSRMEIVYSLGYARLRSAMIELRRAGVQAVDLSTRLPPERVPPDDVFLDFVHLNHTGNKIVAEAMFEHLVPRMNGCVG